MGQNVNENKAMTKVVIAITYLLYSIIKVNSVLHPLSRTNLHKAVPIAMLHDYLI